MTTRETLVAALLLFALLTAGRYLARTALVSLSKVLIVLGVSAFAIAAVRASMLIPVCVSIVLMVLLVKPQSGSQVAQRRMLVAAIVAILIVGPVLTGYLGGYDFGVGDAFRTATSARENIAALSDDIEWSKNSIGMLLMPGSLFQSILFLPPRMVLYLVAPLPNVYVSVRDLLAGSWSAWQQLLTLLSSVINVLAIPYVLASFVQSIKTREANAAPLVFHISYWVTFMAIAGGNLIIQERYRAMASLLLLGCAWLGARTCSKPLVRRASLLWYGLLTIGALFYLSYKAVGT